VAESRHLKLLRKFVFARRDAAVHTRRIQERSGAVFSTLRHELSLTQAEMADKLGVTNVYLCFVERGKRVPAPSLIERLFDVVVAECGGAT
jgi:DNA-binding XRE family transcriptional regulator